MEMRLGDAHRPSVATVSADICRFRECVGGSGGRDTSAHAKTTVHSARYD